MKQLSILVIILILCTGCIPRNYIEQLGIITAVGYDLLEENKLEGTMVIYQFDPTTSSTTQVVTSQAETSKGLRFEANRQTSHKLVSGQVRLAMYENELASKGMMKYMDTLSRDPRVSDLSYLAISDVPTKELLGSNSKEHTTTNTGNFIQKLIEKSIKSEMIPNAAQTVFMHEYHDTGIDPVLPLLSLKNNQAYVAGLALFQDDRYVNSVTEEEIIPLMLLKNEFDQGEFQLELPPDSLSEFHKKTSIDPPSEGPLNVSLHKMNTNLKIQPKKGDPTTQSVKITIEARLLEITKDIDLKQKKAIQALEKEVEKQMKANLENLIKKLKEERVDPVGFGKEYNEHNRTNRVTKENWRNQIPDLNVSFDVKVKILRHGITE